MNLLRTATTAASADPTDPPCDLLGFHGGNTFNHYRTVSATDLPKPTKDDITLTSVHTHTNTETKKTRVWLRGPNETAWVDVSADYFALKPIAHPVLPEYSLSRNRATSTERPNFVKGFKKYVNSFVARDGDYKF